MTVANKNGMNPTPQISHSNHNDENPSFWARLLQIEELRDRTPLEQLLAGCEVIAALDGVDLLAA